VGERPESDVTAHLTAKVRVDRFREMPPSLARFDNPNPLPPNILPPSSDAEVLAEVQSGRRRMGFCDPPGVTGVAWDEVEQDDDGCREKSEEMSEGLFSRHSPSERISESVE
jgi:hypothetical protein